MTRLLGVRANLLISVAFAISGLLAGIVAIFWVGRSSLVEPAVGLQPVLIAFIAAVVGGMENLKGAVLGGYLLGFAVKDAAAGDTHVRGYLLPELIDSIYGGL